MISNTIKKKFSSSIKGRVYFDRLFKDYTSFRIGGPARIWIEPVDLQDLQNAIYICNKSRFPIFLIGNGSNLLVDDRNIRKAVIQLSPPFFKEIEFPGKNQVICGSGASLADLIEVSIRKGLGGLEFLAGIPGTVGGAVVMNAGSPTETVGKFVEWIRVMDYEGGLKELRKKKLQFGYRKSNLFDKIILQVGFRLRKSNPQLLRERFNKFLGNKIQTRQFRYPNAGCIFKNPASSKQTTGQLLESAGLKGKRIGDAQFSKTHANFIVNLGKASFQDVRTLMKLAQDTVKKKYNLWLEPEVKIIR